jgi:4-amino-4-deoxy-L-arabinose transferase-like glycosyltransferase
MDELAHIPAGFGYVKELDFRLNPEHPPLIKALAAGLADLVVRPVFPTGTPFWQKDVNGQWDQGTAFLYESGNDADRIIFWSRLPLMLLAVLFGWLFFLWTRERFGSETALLALSLFAFSPTVLAHSRYVTTDLGAAFGFFLGIATFLSFLERPVLKNIILAGLALGMALLLKFSTVLLIPLYGILWLAWTATRPGLSLKERIRSGARILVKIGAIGLIALLLVWLIYALFTWNYPQEKQYHDTAYILASFPGKTLANFNLKLVESRLARPIGHYLLGFLMVSQRAGGGNTGFFLGEVSAAGSRSYFPLLYIFKEPLPYHFLTLLALAIAFNNIFSSGKTASPLRERVKNWIENHFIEFSCIAFIALYWTSSIISPLNIGVRHVLPTFPFLYLLVAGRIIRWFKSHPFPDPKSWSEVTKNLLDLYLAARMKQILVIFFIFWGIIESLSAYPYFLSYYNQLAGGTPNGWKIATDSNYDWGQDLKLLRDFVKENRIQKIAVDYFGAGSPRYYLGEKFEPWWSAKGPPHGWFAISATFRQGAFGTPAPGFIRKPEDSYEWLKPHEPVGRAGTSIFIYRLP